MAADFVPPRTFETDASAAIDVILTQEANRIGQDIHRQTLHTSPWLDLIKQSTFPEGMGYSLNTLVYDRALPLKAQGINLSETSVGVGANWEALGTTHATSVNGYSANQQDQQGAKGGSGEASTDVNLIDFTKTLKSYSLERAIIESPRISVEELRFAAHRTEQLRAIMDILKDATRNIWEQRYREQYGTQCDNIVYCKTASSTTQTGIEGTALNAIDVDLGDGSDDGTLDVTANISNKIMDDIYFKLVRAGAGVNAYGRENGRPVFSVVL